MSEEKLEAAGRKLDPPQGPPSLWITIRGPRGAEWERAVGQRSFPITSWRPLPAELPGRGPSLVWLLALDGISPHVRERIFGYLATKFHLHIDQVLADAREHGVPILAEDCDVYDARGRLILAAPPEKAMAAGAAIPMRFF